MATCQSWLLTDWRLHICSCCHHNWRHNLSEFNEPAHEADSLFTHSSHGDQIKSIISLWQLKSIPQLDGQQSVREKQLHLKNDSSCNDSHLDSRFVADKDIKFS